MLAGPLGGASGASGRREGMLAGPLGGASGAGGGEGLAEWGRSDVRFRFAPSHSTGFALWKNQEEGILM